MFEIIFNQLFEIFTQVTIAFISHFLLKKIDKH